MSRGQEGLARDAVTGMTRVPVVLVIGASGAVTSWKGQYLLDGTPPVKDVAAGTYIITLDRKSVGGVVSVSGSVKQATGVAPLTPVLTSGDGTTANGASPTGARLIVETRVAAGTPTNPASGDVVYLTFGIDDLGQVR